MGQEFFIMDLGESSALKSLSLQVGSIFKMKLLPQDGVTPKNPGDTDRSKYFVVIGIDDSMIFVGSVLINSHINDKLFSIIGPYQHCIHETDYSFLTREESFIDCFQVKEISYDRIIDEAEYIGLIEYDDMVAVKKLVISSPANKRLTLKKFHIL